MKPSYSSFISLCLLGMVGSSPSSASARVPDLPSECGPSYYFGDGYCDASMNREICLWDGGDCCESTCLPNREFDCGHAGYNCLHDGPPDDCTPTHYFGDGWCDAALNNLHCLYDGGDCCEHTCDENAEFPCGQNAPFECHLPDPDCPSPNSFRNGACNLELNTAECRWDGGDCCESTCEDGLTRECGSNGYACHDNSDRCPESMRRPDDVAAYFAANPPAPGSSTADRALTEHAEAPAADAASAPAPIGTAGFHKRPYAELQWELVPVWTRAQLDEVFDYVRDNRDTWFTEEQGSNFGRRIPWLDPRLECEDRADAVAHHVLCDFMELEMPWKLFAIGPLSFRSSNALNGQGTWDFHVAVVVRVPVDGVLQPFVIDPALDPTRPLAAQEWAELVNQKNSTLVEFTVCTAEAYTRHRGTCYPEVRSDERLAWPTTLQGLRLGLAREWSALKDMGRDPAIDNRRFDEPSPFGELGNSPAWKDCDDPEIWACVDAETDDASTYEVELHGMDATMNYRYDSVIVGLDGTQHEPRGTNCRQFTADTMRNWRVFETEVSGSDPTNIVQTHVYYVCDEQLRHEDHFQSHSTEGDTRRFFQHLVRSSNPEDSLWTVPGQPPLEYVMAHRFEAGSKGGFSFESNYFFDGNPEDAPPERYSKGANVETAQIEYAAVGALQVHLGNRYTDSNETVRDNEDHQNISGAWVDTFNVPDDDDNPRSIVSFRYKLTHGENYESDEHTEIRVKLRNIDDPWAPWYEFGGDDIAKIAGNGNGGGDDSTQWQQFSFEAELWSGDSYTLAIGIENNERTYYNEEAFLLIDDLVVVRVP